MPRARDTDGILATFGLVIPVLRDVSKEILTEQFVESSIRSSKSLNVNVNVLIEFLINLNIVLDLVLILCVSRSIPYLIRTDGRIFRRVSPSKNFGT